MFLVIVNKDKQVKKLLFNNIEFEPHLGRKLKEADLNIFILIGHFGIST